jgi:uncharacterized protein (DUF885 family)
LLDVFHSKPQTPLEIVGVRVKIYTAETIITQSQLPPSQANAPAAFYSAGTPDGSRPGRLYVNTNQYSTQPRCTKAHVWPTRTRRRYEMVSLSLHETNPGHHLQVRAAASSAGSLSLLSPPTPSRGPTGPCSGRC